MALSILAFYFTHNLHAAEIKSANDSDRDGIPDEWEQANGLNQSDPSDAFTDPDHDGFSNFLEYLFGTDPQDAKSHPTLADNRGKIIAYWPLAANAVEMLGTNLVGNLKNGASFSDSAVKLDGKADYVNFGNSSALSMTGSTCTAFPGISCCLWLKAEQSCGPMRVLGKFNAAGNNREYSVFIGPDDRLWMFFSDDGSSARRHSTRKATGKHVIEGNQWQHLAVTWNATQGCDDVSCYINAAELPLCELVSAGIGSIHTGSADLTLGAYNIFNVSCDRWQKEIVQNSFKGYMSQFVLCRGALTDLEVNEIYMLGRQGDLKAWLDMDSDSDGIPDRWERKYFGDVRQTADGDFDGDGLSNIKECRLGTNPVNPDTDGDGIPDGIDADPLQPPSGSGEPDLLPDDWELLWFGNLQQTDSGDYDHDGVSNLEEYRGGTDPVKFNIRDTENAVELNVFLPVQ